MPLCNGDMVYKPRPMDYAIEVRKRMELAQRLAEARKARGLSQAEAAEQLGVSRQAISRWETGAGIPTLDNLMQLGTLYQVSLDALVYGAGPAETEEVPGAPEMEAQMQEPKMTREPKRRRPVLLGTALALVDAGILGLGTWIGFGIAGTREETKIFSDDLVVEKNVNAGEEFDLMPWE